jgi:hypothetical protein
MAVSKSTANVAKMKATVRKEQDCYVAQQSLLRWKGVNHQSDKFRGLDTNRERRLLLLER